MTAIGFYGYNAFGHRVKETITVNVPQTGLILPRKIKYFAFFVCLLRLYSVVNGFLCVQSMLGHSIAMYVVFDMFYKGFRRKFTARFPNVPAIVSFYIIIYSYISRIFHLFKFVDKGFRVGWVLVTYLMAVLIPRLAVMIPLVC